MDVEKLINGVQQRPALWDTKHKFYHNRDIVRRSWNEVAQECEVDEGEQVKTKWKNLRDTFRSELKKTNKRHPGDVGGSVYQSTWPWFEAMNFIKDIMISRRMSRSVLQQGRSSASYERSDDSLVESISKTSRSDMDDQGFGHSSSETSAGPSASMAPPAHRPKKTKKRTADAELISIEREKLKLLEKQMSIAENQDDSYHFVMSLLPMMRQLPPDCQLRARIRMQEILLDEMTNRTRDDALFSFDRK